MTAVSYAEPRDVGSVDDCYFYHTMDVPGFGTIQGEWDLRGREHEYLGGVSLQGKRVLEMGTANGFLCFYMEKQGASVTAYDLSERDSWDIVPFSRIPQEKFSKMVDDRRRVIGRLNNGFWLAHKAHRSKAKVIYGPVYAVPDALEPVDIVTFTSILLHVRDPFLALQTAAKHARETIIVTERIAEGRLTLELLERSSGAYARFLPAPEACEPWETWWSLTPEIIRRFVRVLGFEKTKTSYFKVETGKQTHAFFTVVGRR